MTLIADRELRGGLPMRESQIQGAVMRHWQVQGFPDTLVAAIPNAHAHGQFGLTRGLPDLLVIGPNGVGFIELKRDGGKLSEPQKDFAALCEARGIPHAVTYGRDEPIEVLKQWGVVR